MQRLATCCYAYNKPPVPLYLLSNALPSCFREHLVEAAAYQHAADLLGSSANGIQSRVTEQSPGIVVYIQLALTIAHVYAALVIAREALYGDVKRSPLMYPFPPW